MPTYVACASEASSAVVVSWNTLPSTDAASSRYARRWQSVEPRGEECLDCWRDLELGRVATLLEDEREQLLDEEWIPARSVHHVAMCRAVEAVGAREVVDELGAFTLGQRLEMYRSCVQLATTPQRPGLV